MGPLHGAVHRLAIDLRRLIATIDADAGDTDVGDTVDTDGELGTADRPTVRASVRRNLDVQLAGLTVLERELRSGRPGRRVWSLGQAAMPVLPILLTSVSRQAPAIDPALIARCRTSVEEMGRALSDLAEGRPWSTVEPDGADPGA